MPDPVQRPVVDDSPDPPAEQQLRLPAQREPERTQASAEQPPAIPQVGWGFITLYALAFMSTTLLFLAPALVSLALKVDDLVGIDAAPKQLSLVAGLGAALSIVANPVFGQLSDRTTSRWGMRRPWMILGLVAGTFGIVIVSVAPNIAMVVLGWCIAQVFYNALLAAQVAVLADQVPPDQRGMVAGVLGVCLPVASICGTFLVNVFSPHLTAMFLGPCALAAVFIVIFVATLHDRVLPQNTRQAAPRARRRLPRIRLPRSNDFTWAFVSKFFFVLALAFLTTYQAFYLLTQIGTKKSDVPHQVFVGTLVQGLVVIAASLVGGRLSDRTGRRKVFVLTASAVFAMAMFVVAAATGFNGFVVGMALSGLGLGLYLSVDLALVIDVLPDRDHVAKDLGLFNIAGALPYALAPALAPGILALTDDSYAVVYAVAAFSAVVGALAILRVRGVR